jgi:hypothetical protein
MYVNCNQLQTPMCDPLAESCYAESALEGWGRVTGKMRKSFQGKRLAIG